MTAALTLYVDRAGRCRWVDVARAALRAKQLPFSERALDLARGEQCDADFVARSLTATVPALEHAGRVITESLAIAEYLAESFPFPAHPRLFPADLGERARARQLMLWLRSAAPGPDALLAMATRALGDRATVCSSWCIADSDLALALAEAQAAGARLPAPLAALVARELGGR
ncbi:MAG: glutathione S-transferase N-terminal domain-containing protein [Deltaproteobacteria bacterium]|nr:glutathione S-transferase N-terminal domain-containing protein [Deltaproteobacteria bacterium]